MAKVEPFGKKPNWRLLQDAPEFLLIQDTCDEYGGMSVTNGAEWVVEQLLPTLNGRRLYYVDTMGNTDELLRPSAE